MENKYENTLLYLIEHCNNQFLGETKLNKLLYYCDFISFRDNKKTITGNSYVKREMGPVVESGLYNELARLRNEGKIKFEDRQGNYNAHRYYLSDGINANISKFNGSELDIIRKVCDIFQYYTTDQISNQSHGEAPWLFAKLGDRLDYTLSINIDIDLDQDDDL